MTLLDSETVTRLRSRPQKAVWREVKESIYRAGGSSEDFLAAFTQLVDAGVLSWEQIEEFESAT